jgi:macrodomain Ter protein organizer (MatP/YcbG family)
MANKKQKVLSVRIPVKNWKQYENEAKKLNITVSEFIRTVIDERFKQSTNFGLQPNDKTTLLAQGG